MAMIRASGSTPPDTTHALRLSSSEKILLGLVGAIYFVIAVYSALRRTFWFDELSTLFITSTPTLRTMFHAMPTDGNPPLYFLLARPLLYLPIKTELALRLPSAFAYLFTMFAIYWFVRRDTRAVYAFFAAGMFLSTKIHLYAIEGRAYSLLMAFTLLTLCTWQSYCRSGKPLALGGVSVGIVGAILSHQYGVIYAMLPLAVGEAVRCMRLRKFDYRVFVAAAVFAPALLITVPQMLHGQKMLLDAIRSSTFFTGYPRLRYLKMYAYMLPPVSYPLIALAALVLVLKLAISKPKTELKETPNCPIEDVAVAVTLTLFLPLMLAATRLGTNIFQLRYGIGSAIGLSILIPLLLSRIELRWRHAASLAWAGAVYCLAIGMLGLWVTRTRPEISPLQDPVFYAGPRTEPIVVADALEFSPLWWYADPALRVRLHYLEDLDYAREHSDMIPEYSLALEHDYTPMQMENYQSFLAAHQHFLLYSYGVPRLEWIKQRLVNEGWHLTLLSSAKQTGPIGDVGQQYRELFQVSR